MTTPIQNKSALHVCRMVTHRVTPLRFVAGNMVSPDPRSPTRHALELSALL